MVAPLFEGGAPFYQKFTIFSGFRGVFSQKLVKNTKIDVYKPFQHIWKPIKSICNSFLKLWKYWSQKFDFRSIFDCFLTTSEIPWKTRFYDFLYLYRFSNMLCHPKNDIWLAQQSVFGQEYAEYHDFCTWGGAPFKKGRIRQHGHRGRPPGAPLDWKPCVYKSHNFLL